MEILETFECNISKQFESPGIYQRHISWLFRIMPDSALMPAVIIQIVRNPAKSRKHIHFHFFLLSLRKPYSLLALEGYVWKYNLCFSDGVKLPSKWLPRQLICVCEWKRFSSCVCSVAQKDIWTPPLCSRDRSTAVWRVDKASNSPPNWSFQPHTHKDAHIHTHTITQIR